MPPIQPDEISLLKARDLNPVLKGLKVLVLVLPVFLISLMVNRALVGDWIVVFILTAIVFATLYAGSELRRGKVGRVTLFLSIFFVLAITVVCTIGGGIHDIVIVAYPLILGFSSILLKIREIIITSVLSFLSVGWLVLNEACGFYSSQSVESGLVSDFVSTSTFVVMGGVLTFLITGNIKESLLQVNKERDKTKLAAEALEDELKEKNLLIKEVHEKASKSLSYIGLLTGLGQSPDALQEDEYKNLRRKIISIESAHDILNEISTFEYINLKDYVPVILSRYEDLYEKRIGLNSEIQSDILVSLDEAVSLGFCLLELVHREEASDEAVQITLKQEAGRIRLEIGRVRSSGQGLTQSPDPGSVLIDMMVRQLEGQLERRSAAGGSTIIFHFAPKEKMVV